MARLLCRWWSEAFVCGLLAAGVLAPGGLAAADTLNVGVGQTYATIAAAIAAAGEDDVINVVDAVHTEQGIYINTTMPVTIQGQGPEATIVQAHANPYTATTRVFSIGSDATVTIRDMKIRHGNLEYDGAGGAGIRTHGNLTLERAVVTLNRAISNGDSSAGGGGLVIYGDTTMTDCVISDNLAEGYHLSSSGHGVLGYGGGMMVTSGATLIAERCTFSGNVAQGGDGVSNDGGTGWGGAIAVPNAIVWLYSCLLTGNQALGGAGDGGTGGTAKGGAVHADSGGTVRATNTTITGNSATGGTGTTQGEALGGGATLYKGRLSSCTVANNQVSGGVMEGGGLHTLSATTGNGPKLQHCVLADNTGPDPSDGPDLYGYARSFDYNLIETTGGYVLSGTTTNTVSGVDPNLAPLADNGGATWTQALLSPSQAIDLIPVGTDGCVPDESVDQRAFARAGGTGAGGAACDAGAFEYDSMLAAIFSDGFESGDTSAW